MKKIFKIIPALFAVGILTACDSIKIDVKEPSFASKGKNIGQDEFRSAITAAYYENEFFKETLLFLTEIVAADSIFSSSSSPAFASL